MLESSDRPTHVSVCTRAGISVSGNGYRQAEISSHEEQHASLLDGQGLMAAFMVFASIPDILQIPEAVSIFGHLGYPRTLLPFLGTAKTLGVVAVLVPGVARLKEWAFAGLVVDLIGALYSHLSVGDGPSVWMPAVIGLLLVSGSYVRVSAAPER